jgi:uncharacterized membrane protein (UPF0182 family)
VARASVASPTFFPPSCRRFHRYYLRKPDGILLLVDALWFGSLGYGDVFRKTVSIRWAIFAASFAATFFVLYGWFLALRRAYQPDLLSSGIIYIARQPVKLPGVRILRLIALIVTLLVAAATAAAMSGEWPTFGLCWYAPRATAELSIQSSAGRCTFNCSRFPAGS